jgi:hypothetical protein
MAVARALQMRNADLRCRLRGVHLDIGYVNDICVSRNVDECVFLDETRPEVHIAPAKSLDQGGEGDKRALEKDASTHQVRTPDGALPKSTLPKHGA